MTRTVVARKSVVEVANAAEANKWIEQTILDYASGGEDLEGECIELAKHFKLNVAAISFGWLRAREKREAWQKNFECATT
jgi:hypothetical protein